MRLGYIGLLKPADNTMAGSPTLMIAFQRGGGGREGSGTRQIVPSSAAAYQTNRSLCDKSTKIGIHID